MKKGNDKGFSLVEIIIVIAIMAILVGVMAPLLIRYVEKANVSADQQMLNSIYAAVVYAIEDPTVNEDDASKQVIDSMINPMTLDQIPSGCLLYDEILSSIGWTDLSQNNYVGHIKSAHLSSSKIMFQFKGTFNNPIAMWITNTDETGNKDTSESPANYTGIEHCIGIY